MRDHRLNDLQYNKLCFHTIFVVHIDFSHGFVHILSGLNEESDH